MNAFCRHSALCAVLMTCGVAAITGIPRECHAQQTFTPGIEILDPSPYIYIVRSDQQNKYVSSFHILLDSQFGDFMLSSSPATGGTSFPFTVESGAPTNSFYINSAGAMGIGTGNPEAILHVSNPAGLGAFRLDGTNGGQTEEWEFNSDPGIYIPGGGLAIVSVSGGTAPVEIQNGAATNSLHIAKSGHIGLKVANPTKPLQLAGGAYCTGAVWKNASSRELKENIEPISSELARETVRKLQPVGYRYKNEPEESYVGFIAEDVPELVASRDRKALSSMDIVAVLTKVVQDQDVIVRGQEKVIADERERNDRLEAIVNRQEKLLDLLNKRLEQLEAKPR